VKLAGGYNLREDLIQRYFTPGGWETAKCGTANGPPMVRGNVDRGELIHSYHICAIGLRPHPGLTAVRLWRELRDRGYLGGYTAVKRTVRGSDRIR
jgi:hypothetical protein